MSRMEKLTALILCRIYELFRKTEYFCRVVNEVKIKPMAKLKCVCNRNDWELIRFINCAGVLYSAIRCKHCKAEMASNTRVEEIGLIEYWNKTLGRNL